MQHQQQGRVDIAQGEATLSASIGNELIISKYLGRPWTVGEHAALQDIVSAGVALMQFFEQEVAQ
jgi:hypothetical protein